MNKTYKVGSKAFREAIQTAKHIKSSSGSQIAVEVFAYDYAGYDFVAFEGTTAICFEYGERATLIGVK